MMSPAALEPRSSGGLPTGPPTRFTRSSGPMAMLKEAHDHFYDPSSNNANILSDQDPPLATRYLTYR